MNFPSELLYARTHEWARLEGDQVTVGITDFAVEELDKEIVNVDLPEPGTATRQGESFGMLDAVKAACDLYSPVTGVIEEANSAVMDDPTLVANAPYTEGWMVRIRATSLEEMKTLLSPEAYREHVESEESH